MKKTKRTKVLIVEDELLVALNLSKELEALGFKVTGLAASEEEAISLAKDTQPHIILMDINLGVGGSGIKAAASIAKEHAIPVIYVTAYSDDKVIKLAGNTKPFGYILKPYNAQEVKAAIKTALVRLKCENKIRESEQRLIVAINAADLDVLEYNDKQQSISLSQGTEKVIELGFKKAMSKQEFLSLFVESDALSLDHLLSLGNAFNKRVRLQRKGSGSSQYVDVFLSNIHYKNNKVQIGAIQDVTYAQQNITNLQISDSLLNQMQESVIVLDSNEIIQKVNPAFCQLVGQSEADITGCCINDFLLRLRNNDISIVAATQQKEVGKRRSEVTLRCKDESLVHAMLTVGELKDLDDTQKIVLTLTDISRLVEAERSLHKIAFSDALTGFGNRSYLNRLLNNLSKTSRSENVALFYIDLDSFKNVNDSLGHETGDKVLVEFARRLASVFRDKDHLVRIGGDEFVAIITGSFNKTALKLIGDKILKLFANEFIINEQEIVVSCSLGIAYSSLREFTAEELLKQADSAMYHAKKMGKNTYRFFDADLAQHTQYRIFIEQGLKAALRDKLVTVYFQPIVDYSGKVVSVEGLCRWYDSKVGFIAPTIFISAAEETQLIQSLGLTIINECMMAKKQLIEAGFGDITVNINFSEKQLQNHCTFDVVSELLAQYRLDASGFVIEITESILHSAASDKTIKLLMNKGFRFALDDFGTGYSSLSRLHDYNVSIVKIDKSFIDLLSSSSKQNLITHSIIELGQRLDYEVVAEGVETIEQCNILRTMGCDSMQGYYFSKPMPIHKLLRYLTMAQ